MASLIRAGSGIALNRASISRSALTDCGKKPRRGASTSAGERARPVAETSSDESSVRIRSSPRGWMSIREADRLSNVIAECQTAKKTLPVLQRLYHPSDAVLVLVIHSWLRGRGRGRAAHDRPNRSG